MSPSRFIGFPLSHHNPLGLILGFESFGSFAVCITFLFGYFSWVVHLMVVMFSIFIGYLSIDSSPLIFFVLDSFFSKRRMVLPILRDSVYPHIMRFMILHPSVSHLHLHWDSSILSPSRHLFSPCGAQLRKIFLSSHRYSLCWCLGFSLVQYLGPLLGLALSLEVYSCFLNISPVLRLCWLLS